MARTRDYYFGNDPETVTATKSASYTIDTKTRIRLDNDGFGYLMADIIIYDTDGVTVVDPANYTLYQDAYYTTQEALPGGSEKTIYGDIEITNATYADVEIFISGLNFGSYTTNEASSGGGGGTYSEDYPYNYLDADENVNPDIVWFPENELWYSSKVDDNIGNPPTTGDATDAYWQVEGGLSGVIQDFDGQIAHVDTVASESIATGWIELTASQQLVLRTAYPKYSAFVPSPQWGGDVLNAGIPSYSDLGLAAPETGSSHVIYIGNGSLSVVEDTLLDQRVTDLENTLAVVEAPKKSGWIDSSNDWEDKEFAFTHSLGVSDIGDIDIKFLFRNGSAITEYDVLQSSAQDITLTGDLGARPIFTSSDVITIKTATLGFVGFNDAGAVTLINNIDLGQYQIVVTKKASAPLIQANYAPFKDWVEDTSFVASGTQTVTHEVTDGEYRAWISEGTNLYNTRVLVDSSKVSCVGVWDKTLNLGYTVVTGLWDTGSATFSIIKIEKWEDTTGANKPSVALSDGWETVWEDYDNIGSVDIDLPTGDYVFKFGDDTATGTVSHEGRMSYIKGLGGSQFSTMSVYSSTLGSMRAVNGGSSTVFSCGYTGFSIRSIKKQIGKVTLSVNHTNRTISGVPQTFMFKKDTTAGDVTMTADVSWSTTDDPALNTYPDIESPFVIDGDYLIGHNSGTVAAGNDLLGMPESSVIPPRGIVTFLADKDNHEWVTM